MSRLAANEQRERAAIPLELGKPVIDRGRVAHAPGQLIAREIAEAEEQVVNAVGVPRGAFWREMLKLELELGERLGVEQLAKLGFTKERAKLRRVDGQSLCPSLRER